MEQPGRYCTPRPRHSSSLLLALPQHCHSLMTHGEIIFTAHIHTVAIAVHTYLVGDTCHLEVGPSWSNMASLLSRYKETWISTQTFGAYCHPFAAAFAMRHCSHGTCYWWRRSTAPDRISGSSAGPRSARNTPERKTSCICCRLCNHSDRTEGSPGWIQRSTPGAARCRGIWIAHCLSYYTVRKRKADFFP